MCLALSPPRRCPPPFLLLLFFASPSILCSRFLLTFHHFHTVPIPFLSTRSTLPSFPTRTHTKVPLLLAGPEQVLTLARILVLASIAAPSLSSQSPSLYQSIASLHLLFAPLTHLSPLSHPRPLLSVFSPLDHSWFCNTFFDRTRQHRIQLEAHTLSHLAHQYYSNNEVPFPRRRHPRLGRHQCLR